MKRLVVAVVACAACNDYDADYRACLASQRCPAEDGGAAGGTSGGHAGGNAGGTAGGTAGGIAGGSAGGLAGGASGGTAGGIAGGNAGGLAGGMAGGVAGGMAGGTAGGAAGGTAGGTWVDVTPAHGVVPFFYEPTLTTYPGSSALYLAYVDISGGKGRLKVLDGAGTPTSWSDLGTGSNAITRIAAVTDQAPWLSNAFRAVPALMAGGGTTLSLATEYYPADGGAFFVHAVDNNGAFTAAVNTLAGPGSTGVPATGGNAAFSFRECIDGGAVARLVVAFAGSSTIPNGYTLISQPTNGIDCNDVLDNSRTDIGMPSTSIESNGPVVAAYVPPTALIPGYGAGNGLYHFFTGTNYIHRAQFVGDPGKQNQGAPMGTAAHTTSSTLLVTTSPASMTPVLAAFSVSSSASGTLPEDHLFESYETICGHKAAVGWYQGAPLAVLCLGNGGSNHIQALQQLSDGGWQRVQRAGSDFIEGPTCRFPTAPSMVLWEGGVNPMPIVTYGCGHTDGGHGLEVIELR